MAHVTVQDLPKLACTFRKDIVRMIGGAGSGHPGGSLSAIDMLTALYFGGILRHDPANPTWPDRDRFILSKGHGAPALYTILAHAGYFPEDRLATLRKLGSPLQGHPEMSRLPGIEASTGSLGQGLSIAIGVALSGRLDRRDCRVYVMLGDGELDEGQIWEGAMFAGFHGLDNLTAIVDYNKQQLDDWIKNILELDPLGEKWQAFGWHVIPIDGHDYSQILPALEEARKTQGRPTVILANTVKGKGVSFMENNVEFHGTAPTPEQVEQALRELDELAQSLEQGG